MILSNRVRGAGLDKKRTTNNVKRGSHVTYFFLHWVGPLRNDRVLSVLACDRRWADLKNKNSLTNNKKKD